jgi:hypothetical protein
MGRTILELFQNKDSFKYGTVYSEVKEDKETLIEQETSGVRIRSAVELNNPLIYGTEAPRITLRSTAISDEMKQSANGTTDGGLIGKGLDKLTGGSVTSLSGLRTKANTFLQDKLGVPVVPIPTRVFEKIKLGKATVDGKEEQITSLTQITPDTLGFGPGSLVGNLLKDSGGNPQTILRQGAGNAIGIAKDKLRGALFGDGTSIGGAAPKEAQVQYTTYGDGTTYSEQKKDLLGQIEPKDLKGTKLDLSKVSPIYGVKRKDGYFGKGPGENGRSTSYGFINRKNANVEQARYSPESKDTAYNKLSDTTPLYTKFGLGPGDSINLLSPSDEYTLDDNNAFAKVGDKVLYDFIPVWMKKVGSSKPIMFRALLSGLTENVSPSWNTSKFVGNPYNFYTFDSIERSVSFNLKLYCNNPSELTINWEKITKITQMTYPSVGAQFANAPIMRFRIGDIYNNKTGFIESLTYTIPDDSNWETDGDSGWLPKIIDVAIGIKFIESVGAEDRPYDYTIAKAAADAINEKRGTNAEIGASQTEGDGSVSDEKPPKEETKAGKALGDFKDNAKSKLNSAGNKAKSIVGGVKKKLSKPAEQESATLPENANQGGGADLLDGKTPTLYAKDVESKNQLTGPQALDFASLQRSAGPNGNVKIVGVKEIPGFRYSEENFNPGTKFFRIEKQGNIGIYSIGPGGSPMLIYQEINE